MTFIAIIGLLSVGLYSVLSILCKLPSFRIRFSNDTRKKRESILDILSRKIAPHIPLGALKESELTSMLASAGMSISAREYTAQIWVHTGLWLIVSLLLLPFSFWLSLIPIGIALLSYSHRSIEINKKQTDRIQKIEAELPKFVSYTTGRIKTDHNILDIIDSYKANYDNEFTKELSITAADMRTGNQEKAILRLQERIHSPLMTDLARGILSAMRGNDVYDYFQNLNRKLSNIWAQRLRSEALRKEPKVSRMSYILFGCAMITTFVVLIAFFVHSISALGIGGM